MTLNLGLPGIIAIVSISFIVMLWVKLLLQPSADNLAKIFMLWLLLGLLSLVINQLYGTAQFALRWPHYSFTTVGFMFSIGPVLYHYVRRVADGCGWREQKFWFLHWLPAIILWLLFCPYYLQSADHKREFIQTADASYLVTSLYLLNYTQIFIYVVCCFTPLQRYQVLLQNNLSDLDAANLNWLKNLCIGFLLLMLIDVTLPLLGVVSTELYNTLLVLISFYLTVLTYSALGQSRFPFSQWVVKGDPRQSEEPGKVEQRYSNSGLRPDTARNYITRLQHLMDKEHRYRDGDLSLRSLAQMLGVNPHHLSQAINQELEQKFYQYINELRIEDAKQQLLAQPQKPITEIAFAVGYNNKASFYNAFKRLVGMTPLKYRAAASAVSPAGR